MIFMAGLIDKELSTLISEKACELGFDLCGIAASRSLSERKDILNSWCASGMNSGMTYLARDIEKRIDPEFLVAGAKSLIVTGINYYSEKQQMQPGVPIISRYAYGEGYQNVITKKLNKLLTYIKSLVPETEGRSFSDTAPLLEKAWAAEAGIGWQGRHSIMINNKIGSFFFIGILILNIELEYDKPVTSSYCGNCRLCIDCCPTGAINENRTIDARKCIANITIENRRPIPEEIIPKLERRVYGCDICQEVCPWNIKASPTRVAEFQIDPEVAQMKAEDWQKLSEDQFKKLFRKSAIGRKKYETFMQNIAVVMNTEN
jgi:epoxyqueuosine reductase